MNKEWSALHKSMAQKLKSEAEFRAGIGELLELRGRLAEEIGRFKQELPRGAFDEMPFAGAAGYHSKTVAYSLYHIFRIEDIVLHSVMQDSEQIFFAEDFQRRMNAPIITTGNELSGRQIADFSRALDIEQLYSYIFAVKEKSERFFDGLSFADMRHRVPQERRTRLEKSGSVSADENAFWLCEYWCGKDFRGLLAMPFSRHWIMHVEAALRIRDRLMRRPAGKNAGAD